MVLVYLPLKVDKTTLPSDNMSLDEIFVEPQFGRTPFYLLFDTQDKSQQLIKNTNHHFGGKDSPVTIVNRTGAEVIFASHLGSRPYSMFKDAKYRILKVNQNEPLSVILEKYNRGELGEIPKPDDGTCCSGEEHHHH